LLFSFLAEIKKAELLDKFKQLQKSSKLEKYLEKKRKKLASKDRKSMVKRINR
jgi:ribosomal RNA processing protein 36 homolog